MSLTRDDVIRYLEDLSGEELGKLADELLARLGMPSIPAGAPAPAPRVYLTGAIESEPEFEVVLRAPGADKLAVILVARQLLGFELGLSQAKALVESAPVVFRGGLARSEAEEIVNALRRAGADVEVR